MHTLRQLVVHAADTLWHVQLASPVLFDLRLDAEATSVYPFIEAHYALWSVFVCFFNVR